MSHDISPDEYRIWFVSVYGLEPKFIPCGMAGGRNHWQRNPMTISDEDEELGIEVEELDFDEEIDYSDIDTPVFDHR